MVSFIKKCFFVFFLFAVSFSTAQVVKVVAEDEVPFFVKKTLKDLYPNVVVLEWNQVSGNYTAKVKNADSFGRINITGGGSFMVSEWDMDVKFIPSSIHDYLSINYPKFKPIKIYIERKAQSTYVLQIFKKKGKITKTLVFNILGEFVEERK